LSAARAHAALGTVVLVSAAIAWPLTRYFFCQDDFSLILRGAFDPIGSMARFFSIHPGMFRPLSKGAWFALMSHVLGLHATAWHVASIALHAFNTVWTYRVLRALRTARAPALVGAAFFALHGAHFHALAWISCSQQILAVAFLLLGIERLLAATGWVAESVRSGGGFPGVRVTGPDAVMRGDTRQDLIVHAGRNHALAFLAWVAAASCAEQAGLIAAVFALWTLLTRGRRAVIPALVYGAGMLAWLYIVLVLRSPPSVGPYAAHFGANVWLNLWTYLGWSASFLVRLPDRITVGTWWIGPGHVLGAALIGWNLLRRRGRAVALAAAYFVAAVAPLLPLVQHQLYYHTYVPMLPVAALVALASTDVFGAARHRAESSETAALVSILLVLSSVSFMGYRSNERARFRGQSEYARSFVLRRARIARNAWDGLRRMHPTRPTAAVPDTVSLYYGRTRDTSATRWNYSNVIAALGGGDAVRLFFQRPDLVVGFAPVATRASRASTAAHWQLVFDDLGHVRRRGAERIRRPSGAD